MSEMCLRGHCVNEEKSLVGFSKRSHTCGNGGKRSKKSPCRFMKLPGDSEPQSELGLIEGES